MAVGQTPRDRLEERRGQLEDQRNDTDLGKGESEFLLEERIDRRNDGLHHVVEQVGDANQEQNRVNRPARRRPVRLHIDGSRIHQQFFRNSADRTRHLVDITRGDVPGRPFVRFQM